MKINSSVNTIGLKNINLNAEEIKEGKLQDACKEFEAIILEKLLSSMRESLPEGGLYEDSYAKDMFQSMHDQSLAQELAHKKGTGLGEILFNHLLESQKK